MLKNISTFRLSIYLVLTLVIACSSKQYQFVKVPELEVYRDVIAEISDNNLGVENTNLYFAKDIENEDETKITLATCTRFDFNFLGNNFIEINERYWYSLTEVQRVVLLSHELLHCDCDKGHINDLLEDGCESSIMHEYAPDLSCINKHFVRYMTEIKLGCGKE